MKSKKIVWLGLILLISSVPTIAFGQDTTKCMSRDQIEIDNRAYMDALTYRELYSEASNTIDTAQAFIVQQQSVIQQGQKTIHSKDELAAFYRSQAEMRAKENRKLEVGNFWLKIGLGTALGAMGVLTIERFVR